MRPCRISWEERLKRAEADEGASPHTGHIPIKEEVMATQSIETIAGIIIPDTPLVREVTDYIRGVEDDLLFNHSRRVFLFGALQGRRLGLQPDLELLYVGAMF